MSASTVERFSVVVFDGFDELDAVAPFEVLHSAVRFGAKWQVRYVHLDGARTVRAAHGTQVTVDNTLDEAADWVVVPGGGWGDRAPEGARAEVRKGALGARLKELHEGGVKLATVCTGAMIPAATGLLKGRACTTHRVAREELAAMGGNVIEARVVDDGDLVTAGGVTSGLDLALWLVERLGSPELSRKVALNMEYQRQGVVYRGPLHYAQGLPPTE